MVFVLKKAREGNGAPYREFVGKVFNHEFEDCRDRIITFNYDDILDRHLIDKFPLEQVYFDKITSSSTPSPRRNLLCDAPLLIKLHGSVNWRCSNKDFTRIIEGPLPDNDPFIHVWCNKKGLNDPKSASAPLIIPPLPAKPLSRIGIFRYLWTKAYEYLYQAREIYVCGYSLPELDQFAHSLFSNFQGKRLESVTVVDPNAAILTKWRELLERKNASTLEWHWSDDFGRFVDSLTTGH